MAQIAYSYEDAAAQFGVSKDMIRRASDSGELTPRYIGRLPRFSHAELVEWFETLPTEHTA